MRLDLHGVKHIDVPQTLDLFLYKYMRQEYLRVEIITGKSSTMKKIVKKELKIYGLEVVQELEGSLIVQI
jgi:DNA-nicking Smr family endonuclease